MRKKLLIMLVLLSVFLCGTYASVLTYASSGNIQVENIYVIKNGDRVKIDVTNPEKAEENVSNGMLYDTSYIINEGIEDKTCLYTADFFYPTTKRDNVKEYAVESKDSGYFVTDISNGNTYIPVGGFVISVPKTSSVSYAVGDKVTLETPDDFYIPTMAVESQATGQRIAIDAMNATRSRSMAVYYDYQFGKMTGTNQYGTEMVATYDETLGEFVVTRFRAFGEGSQSGIPIPESSFVLSVYGTPYRGMLLEGKKFNIGDKLTLINIDYIRTSTEVTTTYNVINPTKETNPNGMESENQEYPGFRGSDQTIIYKDGWSYNGSSGTGTNVYGYEVAVDKDGNVIEKNVNVSTIPEGGFVISGHGKGRDFIQGNISLGSKIILVESTKTIRVITTLNSYYQLALSNFNTAKNSAETAIKMMYDVNETAIKAKISETSELLENLKEVIDTINFNNENDAWESETEKNVTLMNYNKLLSNCNASSYEISSMAVESKVVSARGMWHRPNIVGGETDLAGIKNTLLTIKNNNMNMVFVETFWGGMSMYKSEYFDYNTSFNSYTYGEYEDYLTAFVEEADKLGIEVHAWVEDFFVGLTDNLSVLKAHPDWVLYNDDGTIYQRNEGGKYVFLDPANPEVQTYLADYYMELITKFPKIKGINLDYIRYPVSTRSADTGYTAYAMKDFALSINKTLSGGNDLSKLRTNFKKLFDSKYNTDASANLVKWDEYRQNKITEFVKNVSKNLREQNPDLLVSTAVFASVTEAKSSKMQDWPTWIREGYIDLATPMAYYDSAVQVMQKVKDMISITGNNCFNYAGIAPSYRGFEAYENSTHAEGAFSGGSTGYLIFASQNFLPDTDVQSYLSKGVNAKEAVTPHSDLNLVLKTMFDEILDKADRIYITKNAMTVNKKQNLEKAFNDILKMPYSTYEEIDKIQTALENLYSFDGIADYASGYAKSRITEDLEYITGIVETHSERLKLLNKTNETQPGDDTEETPPSTETKKGCGSNISGEVAVVISLITLSVVIVLKKKKIN